MNQNEIYERKKQHAYVKEIAKIGMNYDGLIFRNMPQLMYITCDEVYLKEDSNKTINFKENDPYWLKQNHMTQTTKLKGKGWGSWALEVGHAEKFNFENREEFDFIIEFPDIEEKVEDETLSLSSIRDAIKSIGLELRMSQEDLSDDEENRLFNQEMVRILGDSIDDEKYQDGSVKNCMVRDFRVISNDGNFLVASAERGEFFLFFCYMN